MGRREASRDSLTSLWNHKAILEILERELLRSERDHQRGVEGENKKEGHSRFWMLCVLRDFAALR